MIQSFGSACNARYLWCFALALAGTAFLGTQPGCDHSPVKPSAAEKNAQANSDGRPLRLLVFDDPQLAEVIDREWSARGGTSLTVENADASTLAERQRLGADVVIYPTNLLGALAERNLLAPLSSKQLASREYDRQDILPMPRLRQGAWGDKTYALPFGSPCFVLYYRRDIFDALKLKPPTTWSEYADVAKKLAERAVVAEAVAEAVAAAGVDISERWSATAEPWGEHWASRVFLARAAAYAAHPREFSCLFDVDTFKTALDQPPFVRALEEMQNAATFSPPEAVAWSPADVRAAFHRGQCAMALTWPQHESEAAPQEPEPWAQSTGILESPGADDVYSFRKKEWERRPEKYVPLLGIAGRLGSVTRASGNFATALRLLTWASGPEMSAQVSSSSLATTLFRQSHLSAPSAWMESNLSPDAAQDYVRTVEAVNARRQWLYVLRIPRADEYLAILDAEIHRTLAKETTPEAALAEAAKQWRRITEQHGLEKQIRAYRRNFGLSK